MVMSAPRSVNVAITGRCNLQCRYCSHFGSAGDVQEDLPTRRWLDFFARLNRDHVMSVCLSGGEPLCREDLREIIQGVIRNNMRYCILSNGALWDDGWADFVSSTRRCDYVQISLDSSVPGAHDACRGRGSWEKAVRAIKMLKSHGVTLTVRMTINRLNLGSLRSTAKFILEDLEVPSFSTNSASFMGSCQKEADELMLSAKETAVAIEALQDLQEEYGNRICAMAGPLDDGRRWTAMEEARIAGREALPGGGHLTGCGCIMNQIAVRSDGVIVPCLLMSHVELGHIARDDIGEIWLHHPELNRLRNRAEIPLESFEFCQGCPFIPYCTGNCPAAAWTMLGDAYHPSPEGCMRRFLRAGGSLPKREPIMGSVRGP